MTVLDKTAPGAGRRQGLKACFTAAGGAATRVQLHRYYQPEQAEADEARDQLGSDEEQGGTDQNHALP